MIFRYISSGIDKLYNYILFKRHRVSYAGDIVINGRLFLKGRGKISIGEKTKINSGKLYNTIGGDTRTVFYVSDGSSLKIGNGVGISNSAIVASKDGVEIGNAVLIGGGVKSMTLIFTRLDMSTAWKFQIVT